MINHEQLRRIRVRSLERSAVIALLLLLAACAPGTATGERVAVGDKTRVLIGPSTVCIPPGTWLLVRKRDAICAVRITEAWAVGGTTQAQIEVAVQGGEAWERDSVEVVEHPLVGPHPISFQRGNVTVPCGSFKAKFSGPTCLGFAMGSGAGDSDRVMVAPTAWSNLDDVQVNEQRLKWYTIDDNSDEEIELVSLPGHRPGESQ